MAHEATTTTAATTATTTPAATTAAGGTDTTAAATDTTAAATTKGGHHQDRHPHRLRRPAAGQHPARHRGCGRGYNAAGGIKAGDTAYKIELISYDTKSDPNTARSAVERLISQDKATVIFGDQTASNWASQTEAAKVLACVGTPLKDVYKPEYKYTFVTSKLPTEAPVRLGWLPTYKGAPSASTSSSSRTTRPDRTR